MKLSLPIVAAINFSETSLNVATYSAGLAKAAGVKLILLHSCFISKFSDSSGISSQEIEKELETASTRVKYLGKDLAKIFKIEVECSCTCSSIEVLLPQILDQTKAELVVMGMAKKTLEQELSGNTAMSIIKNLNIPVLAVPESARFRKAVRIFFACDNMSLSSIEKFEWFMRIADTLSAEVEFFNVDEKVEQLMLEHGKLNRDNPDALENVKFVYKSLRSGTIVNEIKREIINYGADILVMVPQKNGFWDSPAHVSKTRIMASALDIPMLLLPNF